MEVGGAGQPYAFIGGDARTGQITERHGDVAAAGIDVLADEPKHYRWWLEIRLVPGKISYDFGLAANTRLFSGNGQCRIGLNEPTFAAVAE